MAGNKQLSPISSLPNEILTDLLDYLPSSYLLSLAGVSRQFCAVILRLLQQRLLALASVKTYTLEVSVDIAYGKSDDYGSFYAEYIDTPGLLDGQDEGLGVVERLARLPTLYSRYKCPQPRDRTSSTPGGGIPAEAMYNKRPISLGVDEDEVELTAILNYYSTDHFALGNVISLEGDDEFGNLRLSRNWLNEHADRREGFDDGKDIAWVEGRKNIGFKFRVERKYYENYEMANEYVLIIEEIRIRPVYILLMVNQA